MNTSLFISRNQEDSEEFIVQISDKVNIISAQSLIEFSPVIFEDIPNCDWIFFYSKTGVRYFFDHLAKLEIELDPSIKFGAFGKSTGAFLKKYVGAIHFIGSSNSKFTSEDFLALSEGEVVLFVKGSNSLDSLKPFLASRLNYLDFVVYNNNPIQNMKLDYHDILVFTSPMNLRTYCNFREISKDQIVYVIGASTASTALEFGIEKFNIPQTPSLVSLADMINDHLS